VSEEERVVFVSKSALISNSRSTPGKVREDKEKDREKVNSMYLKCLANMQHFAAVPYAYDQFKPDHSQKIPPYIGMDPYLEFSDDFESSNLFSATRYPESIHSSVEHSAQTYLLTIRLDYNTKSYGQWFYFKVNRKVPPFSFSRQSSTNMFKFMIVNMTKSTSMFGRGLKISVCRNGVWKKEGTNIRYYKNSLRRD
jgi:hypothetical protein